jgi:hypothetical protein
MKASILYHAALFAEVVNAFSPMSIKHKSSTNVNIPRFAVDDKAEVREYFNTEGFNRWNKIYSDSDEVNGVQMDIRDGHAQTIDKILNWIQVDGDIRGKSVCDCGCGVGSLAIPLAQMGTYNECDAATKIKFILSLISSK